MPKLVLLSSLILALCAPAFAQSYSHLNCSDLWIKIFSAEESVCALCHHYDSKLFDNELGYRVRPLGDRRYTFDPTKSGFEIRVIGGVTAAPTVEDVHSSALDKMFSLYSDLMSEDSVRLNRETEKKLPLSRQSYALVWAPGSSEPLGMLRVFNATRTLNSSSPLSPLELEYLNRGLPLSALEPVRDGKIFEVGKAFINSDASPRDQLKTRIILESWLREAFAKRYPDATFIADTFSESRARLYNRNYGMQAIQKTATSPGADEVDILMTVKGAVLDQKIANRIETAAKSLTAP